MNPAAQLGELPLRDIHLPPEPSWWPPAPGWWVLAVVVVFLLGMIWRALRKRLRARRARVALLQQFESELAGHDTATTRLRSAAAFLRRWQLRDHPELECRGGEAWLVWLDEDRADKPFSRGAGRLLVDGLYRPQCESGMVEDCINLVRARLASGVRP